MPQPGFFDLDERYTKLNERDPLVKLNQIIDWEAFREPLSVLRNQPRKSQAGRKPYDVVLMFKILVLQHLYNVSDDGIEYQIRDRHSFCLKRTPRSAEPRRIRKPTLATRIT